MCFFEILLFIKFKRHTRYVRNETQILSVHKNLFDTFYWRLITEARLRVCNLYVSFQAKGVAEIAKTNKDQKYT